MPELPTAAEILVSQSEAEPLPVNCIDSAWPSKNDYLETHYRLLRREGTEALRYAVNKYKSNIAASDDEDMCIYTNVRILGYLMSRQGPLCQISFRTDRAQKKILWQQSRRLLPGSVLAVSTKRDNFKSICMTATVAQRPFRDGLDQNPPQVDIVWGNVSDYVIDPDVELIMVEARSGYFEAVRHTLVGLQMAADYDSSLFKYPVYGDKSDPPAKFISETPKVDFSPSLSPTAPREKVEWMRAWDVRDDTPPDIRDYTTMDETQIHALCRMVSRELSIVQGPPGTGKTFTSVEALKIILANQGSGSPPIIVAAQTNHALDQLLTLCLDAGARIARVGGRTESERIEEYTMFNLRQKFGPNPELLFKGLDSRRRKACNALKDLTTTIFNDGLLRPEDLLNTGVITQEQYKSLVDEDMEQTKKHLEHGPFSLWMSGECIETEVLRNKYCDKNLVGDDAEFDREEYEFEGGLENIVEDDEEDRIYGVFVPFSYKWTGKEPAHLTSWHKRAAKELKRTDLYSIPKNMRGAVYQLLFERFIKKLKPEFMKCFADYIECCKEVKAVRWLRDSGVVRQCHINVVGCTTTGLTKYRGFLAGLGARTMLIEEAAETRESNITSALYPSLQQLILVGDHLQLAPFCNTRWLGEKPYHLDMSMFQRMIDHLLIPYVMLDEQRRMAPEIRAIMDSFYGGLKDHEVARTRKPVPGMGDRRTWLFAHNSEDTADANHSRYNTEEAAMIVNFFAYLINNGIKQSQITVLTFYKAQRRHILKKLKSHPSLAVTPEAFQVQTVDSYQGEENDIVLLSLVRSPPPNGDFKVGFLDNQNRVIVAISRARRGFYVFGNIINASNASRESQEIWVPIWKSFIRQQRYDAKRGLPLQCQPHGNTIWIQNSNGWADNTGGCDQRCTFVRECGHQCGFPCHV
ncbi:P-loop containing nucleoside triphosphate hydrolase protein [Coniochaeta sp. 2T2.1]|nr:P-loop containing nucleoside triphosphate hydrolase protein [Coniochaeta sp. 2T2.1]